MVRIIDTANLTPNIAVGSSDDASWIYNGLDCCVTLEVYESIHQLLDNQTNEVYELEKALQGPVLDMNMHGLLVDPLELSAAKAYLDNEIARYEENLNAILKEGYGVDLNWRSPQQVQAFLYDYIRLPVQKKRNQKGGFSRTSDRNALEKLEAYPIAAPFCSHMLILRDVGKKRSSLESEIDADGHRRSSYNIAGTTTGRLASAFSAFGTGGNVQNIDRLLKRIYIAKEGKKICTIDLEQADSRNVGALCWNKFLVSHGEAFAGSYLDACESGDLHTLVCRLAWKQLDWGDDKRLFRAVADRIIYRDYSYRDLGKKLGHGSNYVGQPPTMAKHAKIPISIAIDFQNSYFEEFPCIREGHQWTLRELKTFNPLVTLFGRRRRFFGRPDDDKTLRDAVAFEGQGSTADEANRGILNLWRHARVRFNGFQLLAQDHDSVTFEYPEEIEDEIVPFAVKCMTIGTELSGGRYFEVPCEAKVGWNRGDYNDVAKNKDGSPRRLNLDGMKKWKGSDNRTRSTSPRETFSLR